jgi:hypothetical protein
MRTFSVIVKALSSRRDAPDAEVSAMAPAAVAGTKPPSPRTPPSRSSGRLGSQYVGPEVLEAERDSLKR